MRHRAHRHRGQVAAREPCVAARHLREHQAGRGVASRRAHRALQPRQPLERRARSGRASSCMHKKEIRYLLGKTKEKGFTLVPLKMYFTPSNLVKVELGLCRGKKLYDKRADIASKDQKRDLERALRDRQKGSDADERCEVAFRRVRLGAVTFFARARRCSPTATSRTAPASSRRCAFAVLGRDRASLRVWKAARSVWRRGGARAGLLGARLARPAADDAAGGGSCSATLPRERSACGGARLRRERASGTRFARASPCQRAGILSKRSGWAAGTLIRRDHPTRGRLDSTR